MSQVKLNVNEQHVIDVLAHTIIARSLEKNIGGLNGFLNFYLNKLNKKDRHIYDSLNVAMVTAKKDMLEMLEKEKTNA